jgi:hypothetical protein
MRCKLLVIAVALAVAVSPPALAGDIGPTQACASSTRAVEGSQAVAVAPGVGLKATRSQSLSRDGDLRFLPHSPRQYTPIPTQVRSPAATVPSLQAE